MVELTQNDSSNTETNSYSPTVVEFQKLAPIAESSFAHGHLKDVSGKKQKFEKINFSYAVITRGYFHQAEFKNCKFTGTRFLDCNFRNATFEDCDFSYSDFSGCRLETDEVIRNLPDAPNIRQELLQILRKNALSIGDIRSGRVFVIAEIAARKEHLRRAWKQDENYYKKKYGGFRKQLDIAVRRTALWLDGFFWGHGERLWMLAVSTMCLLLLFSLISTLIWMSSFSDPTVSESLSIFGSSLMYYVSLFLDVQTEKASYNIIFIDWIVVIFRYISLGVLVSGIFRWLSHR